tara:strand:- start:4246 stop:4623 length:378 start_codon:yes stop_codon:yes gene_type:complete
MSIHSNVTITIDLNGLVWDRGEFLKQEMSVTQNDYIAENLRRTLTWDTLYHMVDTSILEFFENHEHPEIWDPHYGEIQPEAGREKELNQLEKAAKAREEAKKQFKMVKLSSPSWTIDVPVRINTK